MCSVLKVFHNDILTTWGLVTKKKKNRWYGKLQFPINNAKNLHSRNSSVICNENIGANLLIYSRNINIKQVSLCHWPPRDPLCLATCCRCRMCRHSFRQFIVAMEVALSMSRSWSKGERLVDDGRASMLWIRSLCWPCAWPIICHAIWWETQTQIHFIIIHQDFC